MILTNYHTHCNYCDGLGEPEKYLLEAIKNGLEIYGFSSHAPIPYKLTLMKPEKLTDYVWEIKQLKKKYKEKIEVLCSLEIDYIPGVMGPNSPEFQNLNLDYTIGAIHFIDFLNDGSPYGIDRTDSLFKQGLNEIFKNDVKELYKRYFGLIRRMVREDCPDIIAHPGKMKFHNKKERIMFQNEKWYKDEIIDTLEVIKSSGVIFEVNTRCFDLEIPDSFYSDKWLLEMIHKMNIPVMINSDAHSPNQVTYLFNEFLIILKTIGFKQLRILKNNRWMDIII